MANKKKIHFVGIKGVGVAPLAVLAKEAGFIVSGSDVEETFITDTELRKADIVPLVGFSKEHVSGADIVIATSAHGGIENVEVKEALDKNLPVYSQGKAVAAFQKGEIIGKTYKGISVSGSHGKTTTTAMIATVLMENNMDPSYIIGTSEIPSLNSAGHYGKGEYFVTEADEYFADAISDRTAKFLYQNPEIIVVTNIDFDHPDIYSSVDEIRKVFVDFSKRLSPNGVLIACGDGEENRKFLKNVDVRKVTYGFSEDNDYVIERTNFSEDKMFFWVKSHNASLGQFSMEIFGDQNALNGLAAIIVGLEVGLTTEQIKKGLSVFKGTKRRSELVGITVDGVTIYDDYAHHPEEIRKTLSAFRKSFPKKRLVSIFQPHMYSRTKMLFREFSSAFVDADEVIMPEIFPSFREQKDPNFSASLLVEEIRKFGKNATYFANLDDVIKYVSSQKYDSNTIVITMGAGDVYKVGKELLSG
jgi:UDP-N-acetylmuramate--alanine ligase